MVVKERVEEARVAAMWLTHSSSFGESEAILTCEGKCQGQERLGAGCNRDAQMLVGVGAMLGRGRWRGRWRRLGWRRGERWRL